MPANISEVLTNFKEYRQKTLSKTHPNDNAHLMTNLPLDESIVGLAFVGGICSRAVSCGVSNDHNNIIKVAHTVAHEIGHNLGMKHDTDDCICPNKNGCLMGGPKGFSGTDQWSSCNKNSFKNLMESGAGNCLLNKPENLFDSSTCGNGFVEPGEECDCGPERFCFNPCCDPLTCKLTANSTCATGECCDLETCQFKPSDEVCREAKGECDLPEFCNGENEYCPEDVFKHISSECGDGKAFCFEGKCKSRDDQCKKIWGQQANSLESCYERVNAHGKEYGNCGYNETGKFIACSKTDAPCGVLMCDSHGEKVKLDYGWRYITASGPCLIIVTDIPETGYAPNGSKCGDRKVCLNHKCIDVENFNCNDCNGHGVCNSKGNCHCDDGWAPPYCNEPGDGGSIDSKKETRKNCEENSLN